VQTFTTGDTWYSWDVTASARSMYDNNQYYGWILKAQSEGTTKYWRIYSSEHPTVANRPYLEITYNKDPDCGYAYKRPITIDHNQVIGDSGDTVDLIDFPVLIRESGTWLRNSGYTDGRIESADGYDIIFKDSTETLTLAHEIEYYYVGSEAENGELVAWVKIPTLDADANTVIYMYYGNSCVTSETQNKNAVWNSSYKLVQHLQELAPEIHEDSTSNNNDSTSVTVTTQGSAAGKIDGADEFDGDDDVVSIASADSLNLGNDFTLECWAKRSEFTANSYVMLSKLYDPQYSWKFSFDITDNYIRLDVYDTSITNYVSVESSDMAVTDTNWHHVVARSDNGTLNIFLDGNKSSSTNSLGADVIHDSEPLYIGASKWTNPGDWFQGLLDEARISNIARTDGWIQTSFNNQNDPSAFYGLGGENSVTLSEASTGQITDQFDDSLSLDDALLYRLRLYNNSDSAATVDKVILHLTGISGIVTGDLSDLQIRVGSGPTGTTVSSAPTVDITGDTGTITFDGDFSLSGNFGTDYFVSGDAANLVAGDTLTISLAPSDVTLVSGSVIGTAPSDVTHTTDPTVVTIQGSYDDAHESDGGLHFEPLEVYVNITQYISGSNSKFNGGFRFAGIDIPQGSTINSATFSGYVYDTNQDDMYATIYGHAADNSPDFTAPNDSIIDTGVRPRTSASVAWQETFGSTGWKNKDVTSIVQEIINRPGWSNNNAITLLFISDNNTMPKPCHFRSYDGVPAEAAKLTIDYSPAPPTVAIYYSVGTETGALYTGNASASSGTLTLEGGPAADKIGVGDEVRVGSNRYYITGRNLSTEFTIQNSAANGGTPGDTDITFGSTAIEIYRAFNLLSTAESDSRNPSLNYLKTGDLVQGSYQLNWACYADGVMDDHLALSQAGWTTGPNNYIRIYTPTSTSEVGTSQRHNGTWGTGFRMTRTNATPSGNNISVSEDYVRIEGIAMQPYTGANTSGVYIGSSFPDQNNDVRVSHCLINGFSGASWNSRGVFVLDTNNNVNVTIWNTIAYNHGTAGIGGSAFQFQNLNTASCYNCTAYNSRYGFQQSAGTVVLKNCISLGNQDND
jgi:hypothetical protein